VQVAQKIQSVAFHLGLRETKVQVGEDVARRREHALILVSALAFTKADSAFNLRPFSSPMTDSRTTFRRTTHDIEFRVRYAETDQMGVVYHANYLVWCEMGRTDFIRQLGVSYAELERNGVSLAVSELSARFHAAARYDELICVHTILADVRSRMIVFDYLVSNAETDQRLVSARTTLVSLDRVGKPIALPPAVRQLFL
jgi:acyl-CoA thioester hydrolase